MKLKFSPLLIISAALVLFGLIYLFTGVGGNLGPPAAIIIIFTGLIVSLPYFIFRKLFATNNRKRVITELAIILVVVLFIYCSDKNVRLHVPKNYSGHIIVVYGVAKAQTFETSNIFKRTIDVTVPQSGIVFTSTQRKKSIQVIDSSEGQTKVLVPGHGVPFVSDKINCNNKTYMLDVLDVTKYFPHWSRKAELEGRKAKEDSVCIILSQ